jgi:hypothetical protein
MARAAHLLSSWPAAALSLWTLGLAACPATADNRIPCNLNANCPAGQVCKDGVCEPRGSVQPVLDATAVGEAGDVDGTAPDATPADGAAPDRAGLDAATADHVGVDAGSGLDRAAPDLSAPADAGLLDVSAGLDRPPLPPSTGQLRAAAGWSAGQRFTLRSRLQAVDGRASGQRFSIVHRVEVLP